LKEGGKVLRFKLWIPNLSVGLELIWAKTVKMSSNNQASTGAGDRTGGTSQKSKDIRSQNMVAAKGSALR